jgi:hypothetical protein
MAMNFEDSFFKNYMGTMYPMEQEMAPDAQVASADTGVATDVGGIAEIPRNKAQEALGYVGQLLTRAGVNLDEYGLDIPVLGRVTLKDLTVGESGRILEDMSYGFMPTGKSKVEDRGIVEGPDGERRVSGLSGSAPMLQAEAIDLLGLPFIGTTAKVATKPIIGATKKIIEAGKDLPVGMSIKAVDESLDPLGFYSAASKAVDNIQQPKGTGAQFLAQIEKTPGVKKEELLWTGLDEFLAGKKSVTKAEVQDFLNNNRVEIKEVTLDEGGRPYRYVTANEWQGAIDDAERLGNFDEAERINRAWEDFEDGRSLGGAKFSKYTMPGGENYREILLTLPFKEPAMPKGYQVSNVEYDDGTMRFFAETPTTRSSAYKTEAEANAELQRMTEGLKDFRENLTSFKSQHFDQPNVLAHMRVNDRVDADGKKVLFVEEVQSDWHQAGRKKGYKGDINEAAKEYRSILKEYGDKLATEMPAEVRARLDELRPIVSKNATEAVPDAPFKTSWHELALKRAIQLASEGGYDRIAFTTGKTQAERYDLSRQISKISYEKGDNGMYDLIANDMDGTEVLFKEDIPLSEVEDIIGKDMAKKIANDEGKPGDGTGYRNWKTFRGVDLQVGGEGMKGFYDTILPKYLDKYGKKWDAKVGKTNIRLATDKQDMADSELLGELGLPKGGKAMASVHYMDITPKMKESVLTKGQPLFQMAPAIPAGVAAGQQEDNK